MSIGRKHLGLILLALVLLGGVGVVRAQTRDLSVSPGNGYTDVSPGTYIGVWFNEAMNKATVEAAFSLDPPVPGAVWWSTEAQSFQFRPTEPLAAETTYRATLGTGARTASGRQVVTTPYSWRFTTGKDTASVSFGYRIPVQFVTPTGKRGVPIQPGYSRITLDFTLYAVDAPAFMSRYGGLVAGQTNKIDPSGLPQVAAWSAHVDGSDTAARVVLPDGTAPGLYLLDARGARVAEAQTFVLYTDYAVFAKRGQDRLLTWVTRVPSGAPASGAEVTLYDALGQQVAAGAADADGIARFTAGSARFAFAAVDGQTTLVGIDDNWYASGYWWGWWGRGYLPEPPEFAAHIHTDRPIYRPGHTVHYKATARRLQGDDFVVIAPTTPVTMTIKDVSGNTVATEKPAIDDFGSISGDLLLGEDASLGTWQLLFEVGAQDFSGSFEVQEYVKPDYEVKVETDKDFYITGDTAEITVQSDYYFGQPVSGAEVTLRVFRDYYYWYSREGNLLTEVKGTTDAEGAWKTTLRLDLSDERTWAQYYYFEAEVTDASRRPVVEEGSAPVYPAAFDLSLRTDRYGVEVGQPFELTASTIGHDGAPVAGRAVTIEMTRYYWERERGSWYEVVARQQVTTGADGTGVATFRDLPEGWYEIQARAVDDAGHIAKGQSWAWFYRGDRPWYWYGGLEIKADKDSYAAGDTALLVIKSPYTEPVNALLTIEREGVHDEYVVSLQGAATVEIPIRAEYAPNVYARLQLWEPVEDTYSQSEARLVTTMLNLSVPAVDEHLTVEITPDQPTHEPGEQATFTVRVTDASGAPVDAQLSFALVDKAVLALAGDTSGDIFDAFWSARGDTVASFDSLEPTNWYSYPAMRETAGRGEPGQPPAPQPAGTPTPATAGPGEKGEDESQAQPRREFPDTAYWNPAIVTGPDGVVEVTLTLPDTLTTWQALARAITRDTKAGQGTGELVVTKAIIADSALPRFAVQGDQFALDVLGRNYAGGELASTVTLDTPGLVQLDPGTKNLTLPFNETRFARWSVVASEIGTNPVTSWVRTSAGDDGIELPLEVQPFAVPERFARAGSTEGSVDETFEVPFNAVPDGSSVEVRLAPGMALGVLDGLEELIGYPYGCVEQTMSRMLPNAVVGRLLRVLEIEAPEITDQLPEMMALGLQKLYGFQNANGSWGWWHWRYSEGNIYTTAYVLHGLTLTRQAGYEIDPQVLERGFSWLATTVPGERDPRVQAYAHYVLALSGRADAPTVAALFDRRGEMDAFSLAALAVALDKVGREDLSEQVLDTLEATAVQTVTTVSWPVNWDDHRYYWYYWYAMSNTEKNTAMALHALATLRPESPLAPKAARWLMENRWGAGWRTTQGTAFAVLGLTDYIIASGELQAAYDWTVSLDGRVLGTGTVNRDNIIQRIPPIVMDGTDLTPGAHTITLARQGTGTLFYTVVGRMALYYDGFEPTKAEGLGVGIVREYAAVTGRGDASDWAVGDVVNVRLTVTLDEELRYLIVEDLLPAGFEPLNEALDTESRRVPGEDPGYPWRWRWWGYERKEMRDDRVTFFASYLNPGTHTFDYAARVVTPGVFSARPAEAYTMYRPEVWGRSASDQVSIASERLVDRPDLAGDFDRDCRLTSFDASLVAATWAKGGKRDVNGDGRTDVTDIATAAGRDGLTCGDSVPLPPGPAGDMALSLGVPQGVEQGQTFDLDIVATGGGNVGGYEATLVLPAGSFEVVGLSTADGLPGARLLGPVSGQGTVRIGGFAPQGSEGSGARVLARLTLRALAAGDAQVRVQGAQIVTDHGAQYRVTADGAVVSPAPWTPRGTLYLPAVSQ